MAPDSTGGKFLAVLGALFDGAVWGLILAVAFMAPPADRPNHGANGSTKAVSRPGLDPTLGPLGLVRLKDVETVLAEQIARERSGRGLAALTHDSALANMAAAHCQDMMARKYFSQDSPEDQGPEDRLAKGHRQLVGIGAENLWLYAGSIPPDQELVKRILEDWLDSPSHRNKLLKPEWTHHGLSVFEAKGVIKVSHVLAEAVAWINNPVPEKVKRSSTLDLSAKSAPGSPWQPLQVQIIAKPSAQLVLGPLTPGEVKIDLPAGRYQIQYLCVTTKSPKYKPTIIPGPEFQVE